VTKSKKELQLRSCNATVGLKVLYRGACCKDECSEEPNPVCDNEKRTHLVGF
jgi:hypothetical protein